MNPFAEVDDTICNNQADNGMVVARNTSVPPVGELSSSASFSKLLSTSLMKQQLMGEQQPQHAVGCSNDDTLRTLSTAMSSTCSIASLLAPGTPSRRSSNGAPPPCSPANVHGKSTSTTTKATNGSKLASAKNAARQRRNSWMRTSVVRRVASVVDEEVAALCEKSPFLNSVKDSINKSNNDDIAELHRMEICTGSILGSGGFAEVFEVTRFDLVEQDGDDMYDNAVQRRRGRLQADLLATAPDGKSKYAVKLLKKRLLQSTKEFQHAAIDLAVESQYLSALQHEHIVKVRGLAMGGTAAFKTGKHDDYFILMDLLHETLEQRIQTWQQQQQRTTSCQESSCHHYPLSLKYALQIADALQYLHDKAIVYRDLKPQNIGFKQYDDGRGGDVLQIFDFGLCRELPKPKGQSHHDDELEDEETFQMSGVGTQRYMAPEIINSKKYNLKADVFSWSMVVLELMTIEKPFAEYSPRQHQVLVAGLGERPVLLTEEIDMDCSQLSIADISDWTNDANFGESDPANISGDSSHGKKAETKLQYKSVRKVVPAQDWPVGLTYILEHAWSQSVPDRWSISTVYQHLQPVVQNIEEMSKSRQ